MGAEGHPDQWLQSIENTDVWTWLMFCLGNRAERAANKDKHHSHSLFHLHPISEIPKRKLLEECRIAGFGGLFLPPPPHFLCVQLFLCSK